CAASQCLPAFTTRRTSALGTAATRSASINLPCLRICFCVGLIGKRTTFPGIMDQPLRIAHKERVRLRDGKIVHPLLALHHLDILYRKSTRLNSSHVKTSYA